MSSFRAVVAGSLLGLAAVPLAAQQPKPPGTLPGQVERQFQRPPEPSARPGAITIPEASQKPPQNADAVKIVLTQVTVDGVTAYRADVLRAAYANVLEKEVTLADVYRIVDNLTAKYRNDGYVLSQVFVPAQTIEGGSIRLQAVEGYIANVRVEGGTASQRKRAARYGEKIRASRPLTMGTLERYVLLLNDLPGTTARAVLAPSTVAGASDLILQLARRGISAEVGTDNRGSDAQGPARLSADADVHSLAGSGSRTEVRGVTTFTSELSYLALAHDQYIGNEGGRIGVAGSYVYSRPQELSVVPLHMLIRSETARLSYTHPLVRRRSRNLNVRGVFSTFDSTTQVFSVDDTVDRIRQLSVGVTYDSADRLNGVNVVDVAYSHGLRGLGASRNGERLLSRAGGRVDFHKSTLYAQRFQQLPGRFSIVAGLDAQYAFSDLLASEMFSIGGEMFGRAYDPSALLNDHGAAIKVDLRYTRAWRGNRPVTMTPYVFGDAGRVWQRTRVPGLPSSQSGASAGGGVRLTVSNQLTGFVEAAKPFDAVFGQNSSREWRIFAGMTVR